MVISELKARLVKARRLPLNCQYTNNRRENRMSRIMVIDDEKIVGDMSRMSLEQEGYEVETFLNAEPALARLKEEQFDIVITDYKMKGMDGMEVLRTITTMYPEI